MLSYIGKKKNEIKILTPREEQELWLLFKRQNCEKSRQLLISSYQPLVYRELGRIRGYGGQNLDLIQEGNIGLIEAVEAFDYMRGHLFSTFASYRIRGRLLNYLGRQREIDWRETELEPQALNIVGDNDCLDQVIEENLLWQNIQENLKRLPDKERIIIKSFYLAEHTAKEVAAELAISTSYMYKLQKRALRRLRALLATRKKQKKL